MKMTSTFKVLALGGALIAITAPFPTWNPVAALVTMATLIVALAAYLVDNDESITTGKMERRKAA